MADGQKGLRQRDGIFAFSGPAVSRSVQMTAEAACGSVVVAAGPGLSAVSRDLQKGWRRDVVDRWAPGGSVSRDCK